MPPKKKPAKSNLTGSNTPKLSAGLPVTSSSTVNAIMGRKNKLEGLLSSQDTSGGPERSFEIDDDGFVFKRSQDRKVATPVLKLRDQLAQLSDDDVPESRSINKRRKLASPNRPNTNTRATVVAESDQNEDYVEQVSHRAIQLDGGERRRKGVSDLKSTKRLNSNRGKRILSVGNGFVAVPHIDVPVPNYYKLLDTSLPEPHRLRQLLIWCLTKKIDQEEAKARAITKSEDKSAVYIAKVIKEEVLKDLTEGKIDVSWYNKPVEENPVHLEVTTVANPLNVSNEANIKFFKSKLQSILSERGEWERVYQKSVNKTNDLKVEVNSDPVLLEETPPEAKYSEILDNLMISKLENTVQDVLEIYKQVGDSLDVFEDLTYRLDKGLELVEALKNEQLNEKISQLVNDFMTYKSASNNDRKEGKIEDNNRKKREFAGLWKSTSRAPTTRELLRGISRLDAKGN